VPKFAEAAKPLNKLTRNGQEYNWSPSQQQSVDELKATFCTTPVLAYPNFDLPCILTTDASKVAVAAILSQVQNGLEHSVVYASRQLNKPEEAYLTSEAELLALVWAAKHFRCYLYAKRFAVRTDHAALTYLKTFSDRSAKLLRLSLRLSDLDFIVEHRAGNKIPHVDAQSRHVGTISRENKLSPEEVFNEQRRDRFCKELKPEITPATWNSFMTTQVSYTDDRGTIRISCLFPGH